jgi:hypothetical protein
LIHEAGASADDVLTKARKWRIGHGAGLSQKAATRMAFSTARNALAALDGKLDPSMVVNRDSDRRPAWLR